MWIKRSGRDNRVSKNHNSLKYGNEIIIKKVNLWKRHTQLPIRTNIDMRVRKLKKIVNNKQNSTEKT